MTRAITVAFSFTYGLVAELLRHVLRIAVWSGLVMLFAAALGLHPLKTLGLCVAANLIGAILYPGRDQ
jgi:hypothetical protein